MEFKDMTPRQIIGTSAILNALLVKEGLRSSFLFQPPEYSDGYVSTIKGRKSVQFRAKTLKKYVNGLESRNIKNGIIYSNSKSSFRCPGSEPFGLYVLLTDSTLIHLFTIKCIPVKIMEFVKKANVIFRNHKRMLHNIGIYVKTTLAMKDIGSIKVR